MRLTNINSKNKKMKNKAEKIDKPQGNDFIADVSKRFKNGAIWETNVFGKKIQKIVNKEWSKTKVQLTSGQIFTKIMLNKNYTYKGNVC